MKTSPLQYLLFTLMAALACASIWLSLNTIQQCIVNLPAADVWQHMPLIEHAAAGHLDIPALLQKHNQVHFIPLPKLVYALDILLFSGSGAFTACISVFFTLLCCVLTVKIIFGIDTLSATEKKYLALIACLWLTSIVQWESFVNPANLQWSGLNAAIAMVAAGFFRQRNLLLVIGALLAIGCGAQWWLLLAAVFFIYPQRKFLFILLISACAIFACWEMLNSYWLQRFPPLLLMILNGSAEWTPAQLQANSAVFFADPFGFYLPMVENLVTFVADFLAAPLERLLPTELLTPLAALLLLLLGNIDINKNNRSLMFIIAFIALTALAAGLLRAPFEHAYTLRFANAGLLFLTASMIVLYTRFPTQKALFIAVITLYSAALLYIGTQEAQSISQNSNQRRLSQVAYALDAQDIHATSEMPFAPLQELSFNEINTRKPVLQRHSIGIYHSLEHRIYTGDIALPQPGMQCDYSQLQAKKLQNDPLAYKITGQTRDSNGKIMTHVLFLDPGEPGATNGQARGYGIKRIIGTSLWQQLTTAPGWAGFSRGATAGSNVRIIAYSENASCQPVDLPLP